MEREFTVGGLGEVAIRCHDYDAMIAFYRDVIGLRVLEGNENEGITFFRIADGVAGHTAVLALFTRSLGGAKDMAAGGPASTLHHIALSLPAKEQDAVCAWYDHLGQDYTIQHFPWIGWRGVFTHDPDGNTVELVAYDAAFKA